MLRHTFGTFLALAILLTSVSTAQTFDFTIIDVPDGSGEHARGVNNLGQIVGGYRADGVDRTDIWVRQPNGTVDTFALPTGRNAQVHSINDLGQVAGLSTTIDVADEAISFGWIYDINSGDYREYNYAPPGDELEPDAAITEVTNDGQTIVGWYDTTADQFEYSSLVDSIDGGNLVTIDGPAERPLTFVWGTNDSGVLVGRDLRSAFVSADGVDFDLFQIDGGSTTAFDINNPGVVVGSHRSPDFTEEFGFIRTIDGELLTGILAPGAENMSIWGINDAGVFVGSYSDANDDSFAYFSVVPEPSSLSLFAVAALLISLSQRRSMRQ